MPTLHFSPELARRIELAQADQNANYAAALARLRPELEPGVLRIAGGVAVHAGFAPLSQAIALGTAGPVSADELGQVEALLGRGGGPVQLELLPSADPSLALLLAARGYRVSEMQLVLARSLEGPLELPPQGPATARPIRPGEEPAWADAVMEAFLGRVPEGSEREMILPTTRTEGTVCFAAEADGQLVGGGTVAFFEGTATLSGTGVRAAARGQGGQGAVIAARLRAARARGCTLAASATHPGTGSQRNLEKLGFRVVYCKAVLTRPAEPGTRGPA